MNGFGIMRAFCRDDEVYGYLEWISWISSWQWIR